ncbi:MAG: two pore domain potassium channel family protein [Actinobacteria bacterium]|nr:two pore domain potassium channel family protein [Actinomycetota bacterium]
MNERAERWQRRFEVPVLIAALLVIPVIAVEQSDAGEPWPTLAAVTNWAIWLVFLAEVVVMLAIVPNRWRWIRANPLDLAIVILTPPFLPASLQALRVFRLLRLLRLLRVVQAARRLFSPEGLQWAALLTLLTLFIGGAGFAAVEEGSNKNVDNTWDGLWWAFTTMTTVGYGDVSPVTDTGRMIAVATMAVGIGFLTLLIGAAAERFVAPIREEVVEVEQEVVAAEAEVLGEIAEIADRLRRVEASVRRLHGS